MGQDDACRCFNCGVEIFDLRQGDWPLQDYLKYSSDCSHAKFIQFLKSCEQGFKSNGKQKCDASTNPEFSEVKNEVKCGKPTTTPETSTTC